MKFFLLTLAVLVALTFAADTTFQHQAPGDPCTNPDIPAGADVVDYIFAGAGTASSIAASTLANLSDCSLDLLLLQAGRSYTKQPVCSSPVDCYVQHVENEYHHFAALSTPQSTGTRSTWNYVTRPQAYSSAVTFSNSDVVQPANCPYSTPDNIPAGCLCTSDRVNGLTASCQVSAACLAATNGSTAICGTDACMPKLCSINGTNLYYRSKANSNSHHAMVTYRMTPANAGAWVVQTGGDLRFEFPNWERALRFLKDNGLEFSFVSNNYAPIGTSTNDTVKALLGDASLTTGAFADLRNDAITNFEQWMSNPDIFTGFVADQTLGRQTSPLGYRSSPAQLLDKAMARCGAAKVNLTCNAYVTKLIFNNGGEGRRVIGVEYITGDDNFELDYNFNRTASRLRQQNPIRVYARRGVILGGGVFQTPQMLMLNGIGPEHHLKDMGIPVRKHLPAVGSNFVDDVETTLHYKVTGTDPLSANSRFPGFAYKNNYVPHAIKSLWNWNADAFDNTTGAPLAPPATSFAMCHSLAGPLGGKTCPPGVNDDPAYLAALQNLTTYYREGAIATGTTWTLFKDEVERTQRQNPTCLVLSLGGVTINGWYDIMFNYGGALGSTMAFDVLGSGLKSRGYVRLRSNRTEDAPIIDPNTYSVPQDVIEHAKCVNQMRRIIALANALSAANPSEYGTLHFTEVPHYPLAPPAHIRNDTYTEELGQWIRDATWHHHPQGTSRMGNQYDENSVVDSRGRVWGTTNLYVIDMSAVPEGVDMFPSVPAMQLGVLQAETIWQYHVATENNICDTSVFVDAQPSERLNAAPNSLDPTVTGLAVGLAIAGAVALISTLTLIIRSLSAAMRPGYTKVE